jgi:hypothetical protein
VLGIYPANNVYDKKRLQKTTINYPYINDTSHVSKSFTSIINGYIYIMDKKGNIRGAVLKFTDYVTLESIENLMDTLLKEPD